MMFIEDKSTISSFNFWFNICDIGDDGVLSFKDIEEMFMIQHNHISSQGYKLEMFKNVLPHIVDLLQSTKPISRHFLKRSGNWVAVFSLIIDQNLSDEINVIDPLYNYSSKPSVLSLWDSFCLRVPKRNN